MRPNNNFPVKREELIKIALELFLEKGYENTNINNIMKISGLSKGGMYHYFESKEEILDAVIYYALEKTRTPFEELLKRFDTVEDKLIAFITSETLSNSEFITKFSSFKKTQKNSIVDYRIKEANTKFAVPYLKEIIIYGINKGIFETNYPNEVSRYIFIIGQSLFYDVIYEKDSCENNYIENKVDAFMEFISKILSVKKDDFLKFKEKLKDELLNQNLRKTR